MAAERPRDGAPVGPILSAIDGVEFGGAHRAVSRCNFARISVAKMDAALRQAPLGPPLAPADGERTAWAVHADFAFADDERRRVWQGRCLKPRFPRSPIQG